MIQITPTISLDESELQYRFVRGAGPGGQNVNKVATAVQLRFDVANSPSLPQDVRLRVMRLAGTRLSAAGVLVIEARRFRTQTLNRRDATNRLVRLIARAAVPPKPRRPTRPSAASRARRLANKRRRGVTKRGRGRVDDT